MGRRKKSERMRMDMFLFGKEKEEEGKKMSFKLITMFGNYKF